MLEACVVAGTSVPRQGFLGWLIARTVEAVGVAVYKDGSWYVPVRYRNGTYGIVHSYQEKSPVLGWWIRYENIEPADSSSRSVLAEACEMPVISDDRDPTALNVSVVCDGDDEDTFEPSVFVHELIIGIGAHRWVVDSMRRCYRASSVCA